jgi:hypothetical protein
MYNEMQAAPGGEIHLEAARPLDLDVAPAPGPAPAPNGMVDMWVSLRGQAISRFESPGEYAPLVADMFSTAVPLFLRASEDHGSVSARLYALLRLPELDEADERDDGDAESELPAEAALLIGSFRRLPVERRHPTNLRLEIADLFEAILCGDESVFQDSELRALGL